MRGSLLEQLRLADGFPRSEYLRVPVESPTEAGNNLVFTRYNLSTRRQKVEPLCPMPIDMSTGHVSTCLHTYHSQRAAFLGYKAPVQHWEPGTWMEAGGCSGALRS